MGMPEDVKKRKLTEITNITTNNANIKTNNKIAEKNIYSKHIDDIQSSVNRTENKENINDNQMEEDVDFEKGIFHKEIETCTYHGWTLSDDENVADETSMEN